MSIGKSIRYYREQKDVSQQWLADAIGVSKMTVSNFENDKRYPNVEMVKKICEALDITLGKLMAYKDDVEIAEAVFHSSNKLTKAEKNAILAQVRLNLQMYHDACMCVNAEIDENRLPKEKVPMGTDLEEIAAYMREALHLPASGSIKNLVQTLESNGVFITIIKQSAIIRSFSSLAAMTTNVVPPVVAVSGGLDRCGRREEMAHALAYLLFSDVNERILNNAVEYFLLPSEDIIRELGRKRKSLCAKEIRIIAEKYGVSKQCVVRRAKEEDIISRKWQGNVQNAIVDERKAESPTRLLQMVLRAYTECEISISRAAELLQTDSGTTVTILKV